MSVLAEPPDVWRLAADLSGAVDLPHDAGYAEEIAAYSATDVHRPLVMSVRRPQATSELATHRTSRIRSVLRVRRTDTADARSRGSSSRGR